MSRIIPEWKRTFIADRSCDMSDRQISKEIKIPISTVQNIRLSKGIKRNTRNIDPERKKMIIAMLEDYWCNYTSMSVLAKKYKMDTGNISKQIGHLLKLPLNESTKTITLKSKIWQNN